MLCCRLIRFYRRRPRCRVKRGAGISLVNSSILFSHVTPTDYIRGWAYPGLNGIMVITGDRQHVSLINNPNHLEHVMSLDTNGTGARTVKRATDIQPVESHIELRTVMPPEMLPHPPATPLYGSIIRLRCGCS
jgi:hypothetical protein